MVIVRHPDQENGYNIVVAQPYMRDGPPLPLAVCPLADIFLTVIKWTDYTWVEVASLSRQDATKVSNRSGMKEAIVDTLQNQKFMGHPADE